MQRIPIKKLGPSTLIGAGAIALLMVIGLVSNAFLLWLGIIFFVLMLSGLYTLVTGRRSWIHLPGRGGGGILFAAGAIAWVASWAVFGATLPNRQAFSPQPASTSAAAPTTASAAISPSATPTATPTVSPSATATATPSATPAPPSATETTRTPAPPSANAPTNPPSLTAPFGQVITFPSGFSVKMSYLGRFSPGPLAFGAEDGKIAVFDLTVRNGTNRRINMLFSSIPIVTYGPDDADATVAGDVTLEGVGSDIFPTLEPGQEATMKYICGIPEEGLRDVRARMNNPDFFDQNLGDRSARPAVFEGPLE